MKNEQPSSDAYYWYSALIVGILVASAGVAVLCLIAVVAS